MHYWLEKNILLKAIVTVIPESYVSNYKHDVTDKGLLGIAPSVAITFVSEQLYEVSISAKDIVERSGILNKYLCDDNDTVMADRCFTINNELGPLKVELNIPSFLGYRAQLKLRQI